MGYVSNPWVEGQNIRLEEEKFFTYMHSPMIQNLISQPEYLVLIGIHCWNGSLKL